MSKPSNIADHPSFQSSNSVAVISSEPMLSMEEVERHASKGQFKTSGFLMMMLLVIGTLAMLVLITVNVPTVIFSVLTVKASLLMFIVGKRREKK